MVNSPTRYSIFWQHGRVIHVHPGPDNVVLAITLKMVKGTLKRPVIKVVKLPISTDQL